PDLKRSSFPAKLLLPHCCWFRQLCSRQPLYRLLRIDPGFRTQGVLMVPTDLHRRPEKAAQIAALYERMLDRLRTMPGVQSVSAEQMPMLADWMASTYYASMLPDGTL